MTGLPDDLNELPELRVELRVETVTGRDEYVPIIPELRRFEAPEGRDTAWVDPTGDQWGLVQTRDGRWWKIRLPRVF